MPEIAADLRYALRSLSRRPLFTGGALLILALGIGAACTVFSAVQGLFLQPLPWPEPGRLVVVNTTVQRDALEYRSSSWPDFQDWKAREGIFSDLTAWNTQNAVRTGPGSAERMNVEQVSAGYFDLLGLTPLAGRLFAPDDHAPGERVALIAAAAASRIYADPSDATGADLVLDGTAWQVVGVVPAGFRGLSDNAQVWIPLEAANSPEGLAERGSRGLNVAGRLAPGTSMEGAQASLDALSTTLQEEYPTSNQQYGAQVVPMREALLDSVGPVVWTLFGGVLLLLVIACANVANLLLVRGTVREREVAVRRALGCGRGRLIRQFLLENLTLALGGGVLGLLLAFWGVDLLMALSPADLPSYLEVGVDPAVFLFALGASLVAGVASGLYPAFSTSQTSLTGSLREAGGGSEGSARSGRVRSILVASEVALSVMLLLGAGLMIRSYQAQAAIQPGFDPEGVAVYGVQLSAERYDAPARVRFAEEAVRRLEGLATVSMVGASADVPIADGYSATVVTPEEGVIDSVYNGMRAYFHRITPTYLETMGIPLLAGRGLQPQDSEQATAGTIVSRKFAEKAWPDSDPLGRRVFLGRGGSGPPLTVVGVAGDVRYRSLTADPLNSPDDPDFYVPFVLAAPMGFRLVARASGPIAGVTDAVRAVVAEMDPDVPVFDVNAMTDVLSGAIATGRFGMAVLSVFGLIAMILAGFGLYGVIAFTVSRRTREIGIRMALGADRSRILRQVVSEGMFLTGAGLLAGGILAWIGGRFLRSVLYGVTPTDPLTWVSVMSVLVAVAFWGTLLPAWRAARVEPVEALRYE